MRGRGGEREGEREREREREGLREKAKQREKQTERERRKGIERDRGRSQIRDHRGGRTSRVSSRSVPGERRSKFDDKRNSHADDDHRHNFNDHWDEQRGNYDNVKEGEWIQVKSRRRKSLSKSEPVHGKDIADKKKSHQVFGGKNSTTWRDRADITSFYFSHFPDGVRERDLWKIFQAWGKVWEVFVSKKRNKQGHRYGFVRFKGVEDEDGMERRLDNRIYIHGMKMFVNKPKFQRDGNKVAELPTALNNRMTTKNMEHGVHKQVLRQAPKANRIKSYVEVVTKRTNDRMEVQEPLTKIQTSKEKTKWLDNAWVGQLKNKAMFDRVDEEVRGMFGPEVKVAYWGDDMVILHGLEEEAATDFNYKERLHGGTPLSPLQRWTSALVPSYRLTWLRIWGVPLMVWDADTFASIVSACGELVEMDEVTEEKLRVDIARVLVRTSEKPLIAWTTSILVDGIQHSLDLREEMGAGWGRTSRELVVEQLPPSPFSTATADSDDEPNTNFLHDLSPDRLSGRPVGGSSAWSSPSTVNHRRRRRTVGLSPACRGNDATTGVHVSSLHCPELLPAAAVLTPPDAGQ